MKKYIFFIVLLVLNNQLIFSQKVGTKLKKKFVVDDAKVSRNVQLFEIDKYDLRGNKILSENIYESVIFEYDENNNLIHIKSSDESEIWYEPTEDGKDYTYKDNNGMYTEYEFKTNYYKWVLNNEPYYKTTEEHFLDNNGNDIYVKAKDVEFGEEKEYEFWYEYNQNGKLIHEYGGSTETFIEYDLFGRKTKLIEKNLVDGKMEEKISSYYYDENGKLIHLSRTDGYEQWWKYYASSGLQKHYKDNQGNETRYNEMGKEIYNKNNKNFETWHEYNAYGEITYYKTNNGFEIFYIYDYYPNGMKKTVKEFRTIND